MLDLFGEAPKQTVRAAGSRQTQPNGYAAPPGSGPAGEKCRTCAHYTIKSMAKDYRKCWLMRAAWTGGAGTDIKANAPACRLWEAA